MTDNTQYTDINRGNNDVTPEGVLAEQSEVLLDDSQRATGWHEDANQEWEEREARNELKHVAGLGELQDVTEVEYRKVRLERVVLVGVWSSAVTTQAKAEESLRELAALAETAGAVVCDGLLQHRSKPDAATYVGSGKAKEIADIVAREEADTIIVDDDLPPSQRRALEDAAKVKVVDRTAVILDIFAQHATSREGKAQVELAQLEYMLPRLRGWGGSLSRQAGGRAAGADAGIGSRGPGETKIEMDRRVIRTRIARLRRQIREMAPAREVKRGSRRRFGLPTVAVVGYTNAGKSSLLNRLTNADVLAYDKLFATLDSTTRKFELPEGREITVTDTVGFIQKLPTTLIEAFKSTLDEITGADLVLHVVDASSDEYEAQIAAVEDVLGQIHAQDLSRVLVFNKCDLLGEERLGALKARHPQAQFVSAATGEGVGELVEHVARVASAQDEHLDVLIPYNRGDLVSVAHERCHILSETHEEQGTRIVMLAARFVAG